jgi:MFS family permease
MTGPDTPPIRPDADNDPRPAPDPDPGPEHRPLRDRAFAIYWVARTVSLIGAAVSLVVLPVLVFERTGSAALTGLLSTAQFGPYLLFGLAAGAVADRVNRRRLMVCTELVSAVLLASVPVAAWFELLGTGQLLAVAWVTGSLFVWFDAANFGALPAIVGRRRLPAAIGAVSLAAVAADVSGPALAGLLLVLTAPATAVTANAACCLLSALLLLCVPAAFQSTRDSMPAPGPLRGDVLDGLRYLWRHPLIRTMTLLASGLSLTTGTVLGLLVVYATEGLHLAARDPRIGLLFTAIAVGGLVASATAPTLARRDSAGRWMLLALAANLVTLVALAAAPTFGAALLLLTAHAATYVTFTLVAITVRQQLVPDELSSRVNITARMLGVAGRPLGAAIGGMLATWFGIRPTLLLMAIGVVASATLGWRSPLRRPVQLAAS